MPNFSYVNEKAVGPCRVPFDGKGIQGRESKGNRPLKFQ